MWTTGPKRESVRGTWVATLPLHDSALLDDECGHSMVQEGRKETGVPGIWVLADCG